jgi:hypothetical protein
MNASLNIVMDDDTKSDDPLKIFKMRSAAKAVVIAMAKTR